MNQTWLIVADTHQVIEKLEDYPFHRELAQFRKADEQQEMMKQLVKRGIADICLAVVEEWIVGYAVILPPEKEERWSQLPFLAMLGVLEVAPAYRKSGLGKQILHILLDHKKLEDKILVSLEYYWHWDLKNSSLDVYSYKRMLKHLLSSAGMEEFYTDDPDINAHSANFMMGYVGSRITSSQLQQFMYLANPRLF